jgi:hypothetical protein
METLFCATLGFIALCNRLFEDRWEDADGFAVELRYNEDQLAAERQRTAEQFERAETLSRLAETRGEDSARSRDGMRALLVELQAERERMRQMARGCELLEAHYRRVSAAHGVPAHELRLSTAIMQALSGTEPEGTIPELEPLRPFASADDDEFDQVLAALDQPGTATPSPVRPELIAPPDLTPIAPATIVQVGEAPAGEAPLEARSDAQDGDVEIDVEVVEDLELLTQLSGQSAPPAAEPAQSDGADSEPRRITAGYEDLAPAATTLPAPDERNPGDENDPGRTTQIFDFRPGVPTRVVLPPNLPLTQIFIPLAPERIAVVTTRFIARLNITRFSSC